MDGYEWDVFISYRRFDKWKSFLDRHFLGLLAAALQPELRKSDVRIFVDRKNIKEGSSWPDALQNACSRSQVVVPLICAGYWDSSWCKHELAVFLEAAKRSSGSDGRPTSVASLSQSSSTTAS